MNHNNFDEQNYQPTEYIGQPNEINEQQNFQGRANFNAKTELLNNTQNNNVFAWVVVLEGDANRVGTIYKLDSDSSTIGRDPSYCHIIIDDASISRQHTKIRMVKNDDKNDDKNDKVDKFIVYDLATSNGTKLNGQEILKEVLKDNDRIEIGKTVLVFKQVE